MTDLYEKIVQKQTISQYQYIKLNLENGLDTYLVLKFNGAPKNIDKLITTIKPYLEKSIYYSMEILALLLLPSIIKVIPLKQVLTKKDLGKSNTFLQTLQQSKNYNDEFNNTISHLLEEIIYIVPFL